jgi:hypothetical protein
MKEAPVRAGRIFTGPEISGFMPGIFCHHFFSLQERRWGLWMYQRSKKIPHLMQAGGRMPYEKAGKKSYVRFSA